MSDLTYGKIHLFFSYAHEDDIICEDLIEHLEPLKQEGVISDWYDRRITPGKNWRKEIDTNLDRAKIIVLMISPDFLKSDYCMGIELKRGLELHWEQRCRIVPVIISKCNWANTKFGSFQALPKNAMPILDWPNRVEALENIANEMRLVCQDIVDWENPYKRSAVSDWSEIEMTTLDKQTRQQVTTNIKLRVLSKSKKKNRLTVGYTARKDGKIIPLSCFKPTGFSDGEYNLGADKIDIPLDMPLEDNLWAYLQQMGQSLPRNAEIEKNETGRGEQKILVGGKPYYCTWRGYEAIISVGNDRLKCTSKTWRCIDVPLDGIVRSEQETPIWNTKTLLLDYGWGGRNLSKNLLLEFVRRTPSVHPVRLSKLAQKARASVAYDEQLVCPVCEIPVKSVNILGHVQSVHGDPLTSQIETMRREQNKPRRPKISMAIKARREQVKALARSCDPEKLIFCPDCGLEIKAKNLVRHFDRSHITEAR